MSNAQLRARAALAGLLPRMGAWTATVLFSPYRQPPELGRLAEDELDEMIGARLGPLLLHYLRSHDTEVPDAVRRFLSTSQAVGQLRVQATVLAAAEAAALCRQNGIRFVVSKGPGIAAHYPDPALRPFGDLDFLVAERDYPRARALLDAAGWHPDERRREQRDYFERMCREAVNLERGDLGRVDLHHHVPPWLWGRALRSELLIDRAIPGCYDGLELPVLDAVDNFIVSCLHIVSDRSEPGLSLLVWRDIVELGRVIDTEEMVRRASAAGLLGWVGAVVAGLPADVRPFRVPDAWLGRPIPHPRRLLALVAGASEHRPIKGHLARLPFVPNGVMYAAGVTIPDRAFLAANVSGSMKLARWITNRRGQ
jgi:hypothetical protein